MPSSIRSGILASLTALAILGHAPPSPAQTTQPDPELASKRAEADYLRARLARVEAEIALAGFTATTEKQEVETLKGEIALAKSDLVRAQDRLDWTNKVLKTGVLTPPSRSVAELNLQKAKYALELAETKLTMFEKFTRLKTLKELQAEVAKARSVELAKKMAYNRAASPKP